MKPWINVKDLEKKIDHFQFGPLSLQIYPGTITALVGNNGSGKSTLLKMIMNLVNFDDGEITVCDKQVNGDNEDWKQEITYQAQTQIGFDAFTGTQLKELIAQWYPNWDEQLFHKAITLFKVSLTQKFGKLSQGNQQKLILALALARNTKLLLLDEPTSFLDIPAKKVLTDLLIEWMEDDERAIVFASHQADDIQKIADYITVIKNGQLIGHYEKEELTHMYKQIWINDELPSKRLPGEVWRDSQSIITNDVDTAEQVLADEEKDVMNISSIDLEETISLILERSNE